MSLPTNIRPMLASSAQPFDDPQTFFEVKWDGIRCLAFIQDSATRLQSRNLLDLTPRFPELADLNRQVKENGVVLDGEIVTFHNGRPNFLRLEPRIHTRAPQRIQAAARTSPAVFIVFDLLYLKGKSVMDQPLRRRRDLLLQTVAAGPELQISEAALGQGLALFEAAKGLQLEGVVGKAQDSPYLPGKRSRYWRKVKAVHREPFLICGYTTNPGGRQDLSALALTGLVGGEYIFFGLVGSGLSQSEIKHLLDLLASLQRPDPPAFSGKPGFPPCISWTEPILVCEVEYLEYTAGLHLRHPIYRGLRPDLSAADCSKG